MVDSETERCLLGGLILADNSKLLLRIRNIVQPTDFAIDSYRRIFRVMEDLAGRGEPVDLVTVAAELGATGQLESVGGAIAVSQLTDGMPRLTNLDHYAQIIRKHSTVRAVQHIAATIQRRCETWDDEDVAGVLEQAHEITRLLGASGSQTRELLSPASTFLGEQHQDISWLVKGIIQQKSNGFIVAAPKVGKSWSALDLALAVSLGQEWLGFPAKRARVALISREDTPGLTRWRLDRLLAGRREYADQLEEWLWVNTKDQSHEFCLDNPQQLASMIEALTEVGPEFVILDVLNVLHSADENDSAEMRKVLDYADTMHRELNASIALVHHFNKSQDGRLTQRMRGSSAIAGWAEWVIGIEFASDKKGEKVRLMQFELKAGEAEPFYFTIETEGGRSFVRRTEYKPESVRPERNRFEVV